MSPRGGSRPGSGAKRSLMDRKVISISFDQPTLDKLAYWQRRLQINRSEAVRMIVKQTRLPSKFETRKGTTDDNQAS